MLNGYPKGLSVKLLFYKGMCNQASNVNGTGTPTHARADFSSSLSSSQPRNSGDLDPLTVQYRQYSIKYKAVL